MKRLLMDMLKAASILYGLWTNSFRQGARWTTISASGELIKDWRPIASITSRCWGNEPALLPGMTRIPKLYIHRQFRGELCFPDTPTILHAAKALLRYCHMQLARCFHSLFCQNCCGFPVALIRRRERVFRCCSVCETIGDYKEGYLMVWTFHMCLAALLLCYTFKGTCDVISVTMETNKVH